MIEFLNNIGGTTRNVITATVTTVVTAAPTVVITGMITGGALYVGQHLAKTVLTGENQSTDLLDK